MICPRCGTAMLRQPCRWVCPVCGFVKDVPFREAKNRKMPSFLHGTIPGLFWVMTEWNKVLIPEGEKSV